MEMDPIEGAYGNLPTHWLNDKPIGTGLGPVTTADLRAGTADPAQWLQYGGNYANYRHSYSLTYPQNPAVAVRALLERG